MFRCEDLLANKSLFGIPTYEPGRPIEEVERELGIRGVIKMASNENPFGPSPKAVAALRGALSRVNRYPDGGAFYLKRALAKKFGSDAKRIVLGNGSDELIVLCLRAFAAPGDEVVTAKPTFLIYRIGTEVAGARPVEVPMRGFRYDLDRMAEAVTEKTKLIFIANPDNPVGTYVTKKELAHFIARVPERCLIFLDEAYYEFAASRRDYPDGTAFLDRPNVIVARTFSKAYGLSGLRIGYAFAHPDVAKAMNKVREPFNVNSLAQTAAIAALGDAAFLGRVVRTTEREKKTLSRALRRLGLEPIDSATNFLLVRCGPGAGELYEKLMKSGVIVRWMKGWGMPEYVRVTVGSPAENRIFLKRLETILKRKGR